MKPPVSRKAPQEWKDRIPRQGRDPGDYPSVFDELDDSTRDQNVRDGTGQRPAQVGMKAGGKVTKTMPMKGKPKGYVDGGPVTRVIDPPRPAKVRDLDKMVDEYKKTAPKRFSRFPNPDSSRSDLRGYRSPPDTSDTGEYRTGPVKISKLVEVSLAKGGRVTRVSGPRLGKEDGLIAVQKGEFVIRKAVVRKQGDRKMAALNAGKAQIVKPTNGGPRRGKGN